MNGMLYSFRKFVVSINATSCISLVKVQLSVLISLIIFFRSTDYIDTVYYDNSVVQNNIYRNTAMMFP